MADKFNLPAAGLTKAEISELLQEAGIDEGAVKRLTGYLDACDRYSFAPVSTDVNTMRKRLKEALSWVRFLERHLRLSCQDQGERQP